jgi:type I restriction enzyme R subunit
LNLRLGKPEQQRLASLSGGVHLQNIVSELVAALDPDRQVNEARTSNAIPEETQPSAEQIALAASTLIREAVKPLAVNPNLRNELVTLKRTFEQTLDNVSQDRVLEVGYSESAKEKAKGLVASFEEFIKKHKDEITALQVLYSQPYTRRLKFSDIKALAEAIKAPPRSWTPEMLWRAYEALDKSKVKGASGPRLLTDIVSLVRFALHQEDRLVPFAERVDRRFQNWVAQQENRGRRFTDEQRQWLTLIKDHIASSFRIERDDFDDVPFNQKGGLGKVHKVFGDQFDEMLDELNEVLVA